MSKTMAEVIERHHMSHADWDENQFAILCHCGTEVAGEDNGDEAYVQEEALYAGHLAAVLAAAGFGLVADAKEEIDGYAELCSRQSAILTRVAAALNGPPPPLAMWSHRDLGEKAEALIARAAAVRGEG